MEVFVLVGILTKEDVEEDDQCTRSSVDGETPASHPEGSWWYVLSLRQYMREKCQEVADRRQDDEAPHQIRKGRGATDLDGTEPAGQDGAEDGSLDWARELVVDSGEERREWRRIVSGQNPP